ncbi:MAG: ABC transporter permease, partial [Rhodoferax sp.]|nr:ABC transporter permease [Rhodoferax sp.]
MLRLIVNRLLLGVLTLFAVSVLIFVCTEILPGDVASAVLGQGATPEALIVFRKELGLDIPSY